MTDNRDFFRDTVESILEDNVSAADIEAAEDRRIPQRLFDLLQENGIFAMLTPEEQGGVDASLAEAMTILRAAGAAAAPGPLLETLLGNALLARAGQPLSEQPISLVLLPDGLPDEPAIFGAPWASVVEAVLLVVPAGDAARLVRTPCASWTIEPGVDAAGEPRDDLRSGTLESDLDVELPLGFDEIMRQASLLRAGQMLGAMEWSFQRSVEYAMEREQFGRPIGKFQAVQQMLAEFADHMLAATVMVEAAVETDSAIMAASARSRLADANDAAIAISHQVHGAIGFSREYALNHRTRRLMAWRNDFGSVSYWRHLLGSRFIAESRESLWPALSAA